MSLSQKARSVARDAAQSGDPQSAVTGALERAGQQAKQKGGRQGGSQKEQQSGPQDPEDAAVADPNDFPAAREQGGSVDTRVEQQTASLSTAGEVLNRTSTERSRTGTVHVICPMVIPRGRTLVTMLPALLLVAVGVVGTLVLLAVGSEDSPILLNPFFGLHYWLLTLLAAAFMWWRQGMVMVPDGCQALITRFGKLEQVVGPGRVTLFNPWKRVSYMVNTTREYPFNAPIREAPTKSGVQASVDLFVQFRINDPVEFIYTLGAVRGFEEKLNNAISETSRSLIYDQNAAAIYDMVGENTNRLLDQLNEQFSPAVELTNANIVHAEPSSKEYRMDLAAPEMVRVAKEAYTHEYELQLRKEHNEGDLTKELASLNETLSAIQADIALYQAQMDTALERETNRARSVARQRFVEAESEAHANAALLEAQALDIRAVSAAEAPEILEYRYQQQVLDRLEAVAERLPQVLKIGTGDAATVDFLRIARGIIGEAGEQLFSAEDTAAIRGRLDAIAARITEREEEIAELLDSTDPTVASADSDADSQEPALGRAAGPQPEGAGPGEPGTAEDQPARPSAADTDRDEEDPS